jgi:hypothetical protein
MPERKVGSGGAEGGIRTHKGFRPVACQTTALTSFATPAPFRLRTLATPRGKTRDLTRAADRARRMRRRRATA